MAWTAAESQVISDLFASAPVGVSKLPFLATTKWEDVASSSDQVTIITVGDAAMGTYTPGSDITFGTGAAGSVVLTCDQLTYFADILDDSVKLVGTYAEAYAQKALSKLALKADANVLAQATKANFAANWYAGSADAAIDVNSANVLNILNDLSGLLDAQEVPNDGKRFVCVDPALAKKIKIALRKTGLALEPVSDAVFTGALGMYDGMNIVVSNQYVDAAGVKTYLFGHSDAVAVAAKPPVVESGRSEKQFGTYVKALLRYGSKVVTPTMGGAAKLKVIAEA